MRIESNMWIRKIVSNLITLFLIVTFTFFLMKLIPGDPFQDEKALPKEIYDSIREHYHLNDSIYTQYKTFIKNLMHGDLGPSLKYQGRTINRIIKEGFPISLILGLEALCLALGFGILFGSLAAIKKNRWLQNSLFVFIIVGVSLPNFACATLLQYILAVKWNILPIARWGTFFHTILPSLSLAVMPATFIARLLKSKMEEVLSQDYIKTAKSKGLSDGQIIFRHVLKNSFLPILAYLGQLSVNILVGSFVIEKIFSIPGLGQWFVKSILNRDYTVILGLTIFYSFLMLTIITFFEFLSIRIDPRLKALKK